MRRICTFFFVFIASFVHAQDLSGIWRGHFRSNEAYQRLMGIDDRYKMEVQIAPRQKRFQAVTYSYKTTVFYGKADAEATINPATRKVLLRELKIVEVRMAGGDACIMTCFMQYSKLNEEEFLEGTYTSMNIRDSSDCGKGVIFLHKVPTSDFYKEPFLEKHETEIEKKKPVTPPLSNKKVTKPPVAKKDTATGTARKPAVKTPGTASAIKKPAAKTPATTSAVKKPALANKNTARPPVRPAKPEKELAKSNVHKQSIETIKKDSAGNIDKKVSTVIIPKALSTRSNEVIKTITVNTPEIQLNIYDDGAIDNDTVSVYFDNKLVLSKARLTDQPVTVRLHLDESSDSHQLVMVAENLGEIPPNTSLMVVKAGEKRYEVRIVSTEQKNAEIIFKYEKPE